MEATANRRPWWLGVALVLYFAVTLWLTLHHEAWSDETDPWLLMRDGGVRVMWSETAYAGTPALWYLLLSPLVSAGLPYLAQQILNLLLVWCAMTLFVADAPFHPVVKILFLFSYYALIEYAVQARPYALLVALLFGIAATWRERAEKPLRVAILTALMANTTVHGILIGAVIGLLFLGEAVAGRRLFRPRIAGAIAIMLFGGLLAVSQLRLPGGWPVVHRYVDPGTVPWAVGSAFFPRIDPRFSFVGGLIILLVGVLAIGDRTIAVLFLALTNVAVLLLFVYIWLGGLRHTGLILMLLVCAIWMAGVAVEGWRRRAFHVLEWALAISLLWGISISVPEAIAETRWAHSGSQEIAGYIAAHVPRETVIVAQQPNACESILVYLPGRQFWYAASRQFGSYTRWNALGAAREREQSIYPHMTIERARQQFDHRRRWLLLLASELPEEERKGFVLVFRSQRFVYAVKAEQFWLYRPAFP